MTEECREILSQIKVLVDKMPHARSCNKLPELCNCRKGKFAETLLGLEREQGWYKSGKKLHYFRDGESGQGFLSFCGMRGFEGERLEIDPTVNLSEFCRYCYGKLRREECGDA